MLLLAGCQALTGIAPSKRIDYKSASSSPSLELPPDLTTPRYDDRYQVTTATGLAAASANKSTRSDFLPTNPDAKIVRAGNERWLVVKATPEQAWSTVREFWQESGFVLASEQPQVGMMETDFAENRAEIPGDFFRRTIGKYLDIFYSTYEQDKFRTRIERGVEPGTVEIFVSHRGMEQVPTGKIDNSSPAAFAWAVMPPNPALEAEMLTRLMMKFGAPEPAARAAVVQAAIAPERARVDKNADGSYKLTVDDPFDRAWRRVGLALDRIGFTVIDRDRSRGVYFVRYGDPDDAGGEEEQCRLAREAAVLEVRRKGQAGAVPDRDRRIGPDQRDQRAGSGRHAGSHGHQRKDPRVAQRSAEVGAGGRACAFCVDRQRQRRQWPRRRGGPHPHPDRLRFRRARHRGAPRSASASSRSPSTRSSSRTSTPTT